MASPPVGHSAVEPAAPGARAAQPRPRRARGYKGGLSHKACSGKHVAPQFDEPLYKATHCPEPCRRCCSPGPSSPKGARAEWGLGPPSWCSGREEGLCPRVELEGVLEGRSAVREGARVASKAGSAFPSKLVGGVGALRSLL